MSRRSAISFTVVLFVFLVAVYVASPIRTVFDSRWAVATAMSLLEGQGGDLTVYRPALQKTDFYAIEYPGGKPHTIFPIGVSLLSIPAVAIAAWVDPDFNASLREHVPDIFDKTLACFYGSIAGVVFFWVIFGRFQNLGIALATTIIFAFCSSMWSTATRGLWQHGPLVLMLVIAMLLLQKAKSRPALIQYASVPLALAYVVRPTAAVPIAILTLYVFAFYRPWFLRYMAWAMLIATPWLAFNISIYGSILSPYYLGTITYGGNGSFSGALLGNLISPARGLFVYSPVFLFAFSGFALALRESKERPLHLAYGIIVVAMLVAISLAPAWWGGHCFGPRYMTDLVPFLAYFTAFNFHAPALSGARTRAAVLASMTLLATASLLIHAQGALRSAPMAWNVLPDNIDQNPSRLWDWSDPPFLRTRAYVPPQ